MNRAPEIPLDEWAARLRASARFHHDNAKGLFQRADEIADEAHRSARLAAVLTRQAMDAEARLP